jgi:CheY-like chemotaxis protein
MIVEDEVSNSEMIEHMLAPYNMHLLTVSSGEECIGVMKSGVEVDLILMDIKLPGIDGAQTLKELRKMDIQVPVVAQTAFGFEHDKNGLLQEGFDAYLSKPIGKNELMESMARLLVQKEPG